MPEQGILRGLDDDQKNAATLNVNGVVAAGAGSGKTRALASRYAWLITEKKLGPEDILALTFTNKAAGEMYSRVYSYLLDAASPSGGEDEPGRERAAAALKSFHKARVSTLDSFSSAVARSAAPRYGVSPDFSNDDGALAETAREAALSFTLDRREDSALRVLLVDNKIRRIAEEIFAAFVTRHNPLSSPRPLEKDLASQKEALLSAWKEKTRAAKKITGDIIASLRVLEAEKKSIGFTKTLSALLLSSPPPEAPDIEPLLESAAGESADEGDEELSRAEAPDGLKTYIDFYYRLMAARLPGNYGEAYGEAVDNFRILKGKNGAGLFGEILSVANTACAFSLSAGVFRLLEKFRDEFNAKKRASGFLSFNDIAYMARDSLREYPDLRKLYKDSVRMIMIDEFQDNNALQRDLVYLLAEKSGRAEKGIAPPDELEENKMFFVGDEKQSIYRFRGADVSVFRGLAKDLGAASGANLACNYRSRPGLIAAFNCIFGGGEGQRGVFLPQSGEIPPYEARYSAIQPPRDSVEKDEIPLLSFCFLNGAEVPSPPEEGVGPRDLEAVFIARKIRDMVARKEKVPRRKDGGVEWKECSWGDFAVLERSYTHQDILEKHFREFGVPCATDRPSGLFSDAPLMDLRAYLRLLVYPEDRVSYAALIRSPFTRLGDKTLAVCMLNRDAAPFAEENEAFIGEDDIALYRRARERYLFLREASLRLSLTELLLALWFDEGYRMETLWSESSQVYESLFELFFHLACGAEKQGKSLAAFIEYLDDVIKREERPDDMDIPGEGEGGVRIMSIHKSKGLEFPVVFIYDAAASGNTRPPSGLLGFHEKYGVILNSPQTEGLPEAGNYFRELLAEEEKAKDCAELRRLLYVAMTRAEYRLFLTFTLPPQTKEEKKEWDIDAEGFTEETLRRRLLDLDAKADGRYDTFLKLLSGIIPAAPPALCAVEIIPALSGEDIRKLARAGAEKSGGALKMRDAALSAEEFYQNAELLPEGKAYPQSIDASKLRYRPRAGFSPGENPAEADGGLDALLEKAGLPPEDFGSLVHAVLEGRLKGEPCFVPPAVRSRVKEEKTLDALIAGAEILADTFLSSELGKRRAASAAGKSEFPVITALTARGRAIAVTGKIDLLFEEEGGVVVVDFKTDRAENPEDHYAQLAVYYRAAADIFGKAVSVWLFYLRSGRAVDVTEEVKKLPLEEAAERYLAAFAG